MGQKAVCLALLKQWVGCCKSECGKDYLQLIKGMFKNYANKLNLFCGSSKKKKKISDRCFKLCPARLCKF